MKFKVTITVDGDHGASEVYTGTWRQISKEAPNDKIIARLMWMDLSHEVTGMTLKFGSVEYQITKI